jgi:hypothetical protein
LRRRTVAQDARHLDPVGRRHAEIDDEAIDVVRIRPRQRFG